MRSQVEHSSLAHLRHQEGADTTEALVILLRIKYTPNNIVSISISICANCGGKRPSPT